MKYMFTNIYVCNMFVYVYKLMKLNIYLLHDPVIPHLDIYPREMKTYVHRKPVGGYLWWLYS